MNMKNFLIETSFERTTPSIPFEVKQKAPADYPFPAAVKVPHNGALLG
jgi:hypothetical protein